MKRIKELALRYSGMFAAFTVVCSFWFSGKTCIFICHQPDEPKNLKEFLEEKRNIK